LKERKKKRKSGFTRTVCPEGSIAGLQSGEKREKTRGAPLISPPTKTTRNLAWDRSHRACVSELTRRKKKKKKKKKRNVNPRACCINHGASHSIKETVVSPSVASAPSKGGGKKKVQPKKRGGKPVKTPGPSGYISAERGEKKNQRRAGPNQLADRTNQLRKSSHRLHIVSDKKKEGRDHPKKEGEVRPVKPSYFDR